MDLAFIAAAVEAAEHERSAVPFYICGGALVAYAIMISALGLKRPEFPTTAAASRSVMMGGALLVMMAIGTAIYIAL